VAHGRHNHAVPSLVPHGVPCGSPHAWHSRTSRDDGAVDQVGPASGRGIGESSSADTVRDRSAEGGELARIGSTVNRCV